MLESCFRTDLVVEITMQPVRRYGVDAAIFFSDIVVPLKAIGVDLDIVPGTGPVVADPIRRADQLDQLRDLEPDDVACDHRRRQGAGRRARRHAAHRVRRCAVHAGVLPRRGRTVARPPAHQGADVRRARAVARAARPAGGDRRPVPADAGRGRRVGGPAVRLVGRRAVARRLPRVRRAALAPPCSPPWPTSTSRASTSASAPASCSRAMGDAGADVVGVDWRVPLDEAVRRIGPDKVGAGQPRPDAAVRADRGRARPGRRDHRRRPGGPRPRVQPRPRRAAGHRPGRAGAARRLRRTAIADARRGRRRRHRRAGGRVRARPRPGLDVVVFEGSDRLGGKLRLERSAT